MTNSWSTGYAAQITLTNLAWNYGANETYFFEWRGQCMTVATTTGVGFQIDVLP